MRNMLVVDNKMCCHVLLVVFLSQVFISFSHNLYCFVLFQCIMLCYCYGSVSDHFGPSAFNKFDLNTIIILNAFKRLLFTSIKT